MSFENKRVLAFESRRAKEIAELIRMHGGDPFVAPALIEVPLQANTQAFEFANRLYSDAFDMVIFMTGVGARLLQSVLSTREPAEKLPMALRHVAVVVRGPKPSAVMREWLVPVAVTVPEPNTWRELLAAVAERKEKNIALQEYGRSNLALIEGLKAQGRNVTPVPVYNWALPKDTAPLATALNQLLAGNFEIAVFTTGVQINHFLEFAEKTGQREAAIAALKKLFLASIGPTCSEALRAQGLTPQLEPTHPKMGILRSPGSRKLPWYNQKVAPIAQLDRASGYEPEGRVFESLWAHHFQQPSPLRILHNAVSRILPQIARIRLFRGLSSTSANPSFFSTIGTYIPNRPRYPFLSPYHPPAGLLGDRPQASTVPSAAGFCSSALPSSIQSPCAFNILCKSSMQRKW